MLCLQLLLLAALARRAGVLPRDLIPGAAGAAHAPGAIESRLSTAHGIASRGPQRSIQDAPLLPTLKVEAPFTQDSACMITDRAQARKSSYTASARASA